MPLQDDVQIVSVDDHLIEHPRVWQDRLPAKYLEDGPKIVEDEQGHHLWKYEGELHAQVGLNAVAGRPYEEYGLEPMTFQDMIPGCYDPIERVKDMDLDGVHAALCFPSFSGFSGSMFHKAQDKDLAIECVRAWNDFSLDEWCAAAPDRYVPVVIAPTWDVDLAVAEVERTAAKGARTLSFPESPVPLGMPSLHSRYWDPLWSAVEAAQMPLSVHFGTSTFMPGYSFGAAGVSTDDQDKYDQHTDIDDVPFAVAITLFGTNLMWTTVDLLLSGALQRHPNLKIVLAEGGIGWIPYILERTDYVWERHRWYQKIDRNTRPSDLFREHFYGCFIDDEFGIQNRDAIGVERLLLEVDYPHSDSSWPNSRKRASEVLASVPDGDARKIAEDNAREVFNFPRTSGL
jgi:predicted TIM-barrel fold metal-dependent hydrolase